MNRLMLDCAPRGMRGVPARALAVLAYAFPPLLLAELLAYEIVARNRRRRCREPDPPG